MKYALITTAALLAGACTNTTAEERAEQEAEVQRTAFADVDKVGAPENCLQTISIRNTDIVSDRIIDFETSGGKTYRNVLPNRCSGLRVEDAFSYTTSTNQLCNVDIIRPLQRIGGSLESFGACGLGEFQEIRESEG